MPKKLKVVIVSALGTNGEFGGLERYVGQLKRAAQENFRSDVSFVDLPFDVSYLYDEKLNPILRDQLSDADVIHANDFMASYLCSKHAPNKTLITAFHLLHQFFTYQSPGAHFEVIKAAELHAIRNSSFLIANSKATSIDLINAGADPTKIDVVKNGVSSEFFDISRPNRSSTLRLLFVGRLVEQKGADQLPTLLSALEKSEIDWNLEIAGSGPFESTIKDSCYQLHSKCNLLGNVRPNQMPRVYARNDITLSLTRYEPFGLFALESIAAGTPVLGSIRDGMREFCVADRNAMPVRDERIVDDMMSLLTDISSRKRSLPSARSVRSTVTAMTWQNTIAELDAAYLRAA